MKRGLLASYALLFAGFTLISLSAGSSIVTGNAVFNQVSGSIASIVGLVFVGASIGLFLAEGGLEQKTFGSLGLQDTPKEIPFAWKKSMRNQLKKREGKTISYEDAGDYIERARNKEMQVFNNEGKESFYRKAKRRIRDEYGIMKPEIKISNDAKDRAFKEDYVKEKDNLIDYMKKIAELSENPEAYRKSHKIGGFNVYPNGADQNKIAWHFDKKGRIVIDDLRYHATDKDYDKRWNISAGKGDIKVEDYERKGYTTLADFFAQTLS